MKRTCVSTKSATTTASGNIAPFAALTTSRNFSNSSNVTRTTLLRRCVGASSSAAYASSEAGIGSSALGATATSMTAPLLSTASSTNQRRSLSQNGIAWVNNFRYGFEHAPSLGSFLNVYRHINVDDYVQRRQKLLQDDELRKQQLLKKKQEAGGGATAPAEEDEAPAATMDTHKGHSHRHASRFTSLDDLVVQLVTGRRHVAAAALLATRLGITDAEYQLGLPRDAPTTQLIDRIRALLQHNEEDLLRLCGVLPKKKRTSSTAQKLPPARPRPNRDDHRGVSGLSDLYVDDALIYTRALISATRGTRFARDWIAGSVALTSPSPTLTQTALQYETKDTDILEFKIYCALTAWEGEGLVAAEAAEGAPAASASEEEIKTNGYDSVAAGGDPRCSALVAFADVDDSRRYVPHSPSPHQRPVGASSPGFLQPPNVTIIDFPTPLRPRDQAGAIQRCLLYDTLQALHFLRRDVRASDTVHLSKIASEQLGMGSKGNTLVDALHEVVHEDLAIMYEKRRSLDTT